MLETLIFVLIYIAIAVLIGWVLIELLKKVGLPLIVQQIIWVIVILIAIAIVIDAFNINTPDLGLNNGR